MADRYFSDEPLCGETATLRGSEAHHLLHVMRAKVGAEIIVFDGHGGEWWAKVTKLHRTEVELALRMHRPIERELCFGFTLAVALPKGDRQRWLIEKAVELGVARLVPLTTIRSLASMAEAPAKLCRYVIEASKQCGRNQLMEIAKPQAWAELATQTSSGSKVVAHPGGACLSEIQHREHPATLLAIGPEGGFTDEEISLAREHAWQILGLGERILRLETAAVALIARLTIP
jgi:16S rRNA (uracil1498-N3)-methyltransferase